MPAGPIVVVMGVAGCGKSTVGSLLADRLPAPYAEADSFHPPANVAKMAAGQPLDDTDRAPWLRAIAAWVRSQDGTGTAGVVSCSALKHRYREVLRAASPRVWFLHLAADRELITRRVAGRPGHFMPASLVDSQFGDLEPLRPDEAGLTVDAGTPAGEIARLVVARFSADPADR
ncbi:MAG: gluconokinase [Actinobacteria bacterium]|nr:gluconokinase [Actinomycetota bacterium]